MQTRVKRRAHVSDHSLAQSNLPDILQRVYANRGVTDPAELELSIQQIHAPKLLKSIDQAAELLAKYIIEQETIVIVGDYDADGATSTALAMRGLYSVGASDVHYFVPNRFVYGYGLTPEIVDLCHNMDPSLIITVDNGISSIEGVQHARDLGIDVLVTDHHLPGEHLPKANVIVNPNQPGDDFPSKSLAGVGVMFYVLIALRALLRDRGWFKQHDSKEPNFAELLDLVALGTVADVVPLDRNNRILVEQGLRRIRAGQCRPGIRALLSVANVDIKRAVTSDLAFYVGPRINAAGRLEDMSLGIECLLCDDPEVATDIAQSLHELNAERREIETQMRDQALASLEILDESVLGDAQTDKGICLYQSDWHEGVVGILAARIKEKYHRPTIAFTNSNEHELKGSARSIPGVHIRDVLDTVAAKNPGLITKFGGHAMAAGLSLPVENYAGFTEAFQAVLNDWVTEEDLQAEILSDGELIAQDFELNTARILRNSGPWGQAFPAPIFDGEFSVIEQRIIAEKHLKLKLQAKDAHQAVNAIAFNIENFDWYEAASHVHVAYQLDVNVYQGVESVQLLVKHLEVLATH